MNNEIVLTRDDVGEMRQLKRVTVSEFEAKDLAQARIFLGMEIAKLKREFLFHKENMPFLFCPKQVSRHANPAIHT